MKTISRRGEVYNAARMIDGVKPRELPERMADSLPTIAQARGRQANRLDLTAAYNRAAEVVDPMGVYSHARAAGNAISAEYAAKIDAIRQDRSLTPNQRAAVFIKRQQQQKAAVRAIRRRILDEERQTARANRSRLSFPRSTRKRCCGI